MRTVFLVLMMLIPMITIPAFAQPGNDVNIYLNENDGLNTSTETIADYLHSKKVALLSEKYSIKNEKLLSKIFLELEMINKNIKASDNNSRAGLMEKLYLEEFDRTYLEKMNRLHSDPYMDKKNIPCEKYSDRGMIQDGTGRSYSDRNIIKKNVMPCEKHPNMGMTNYEKNLIKKDILSYKMILELRELNSNIKSLEKSNHADMISAAKLDTKRNDNQVGVLLIVALITGIVTFGLTSHLHRRSESDKSAKKDMG